MDTMSLAEQQTFLTSYCRRIFPAWLRSRVDADDLVQESWLRAWQAGTRGYAVHTGLLTRIAKQRLVELQRHYGGPKRRGHCSLPDCYDAPFPPPDPTPDYEDWRATAIRVLGPQRYATLLDRGCRTYHRHWKLRTQAREEIAAHQSALT